MAKQRHGSRPSAHCIAVCKSLRPQNRRAVNAMMAASARQLDQRWRASASVLCLSALLCFAIPVQAAKPKPQEELSELRGRLDKLQKELSKKEASRAEAADALKESEQTISAVNRKLNDLSVKQRTAQAEVANLQNRIAAMEGRITEERKRIEKILQTRYMRGAQDSLKMVLTGQDPATVARQLYYYSYISRARTELMGRFRLDAEKLALLKSESQNKADELSLLQEEEAKGKQQLQAEQLKRKQVLAQLSQQIAEQRKEIGRLKQNEQRLTRLVEEINRLLAKKRADEAKQRALEAEAKAGKKPRSKAPPVQRNDDVPDDSLAGKAFASLKGRLKLPVRGELANRFGSPREAGGPSWKGLFIRAKTGETVRAIADGRVVYSDWLRGFGNLLILDHGGGYMSLYGYNEALLRAVGESIKSGDGLAKVGSSGGNADSGLYFELRYQSKPLDPLGWVAR